MNRFILPTILLAGAGITLAACQKSPADTEADAVRKDSQTVAAAVDDRADTVEANGRADASITKQVTQNSADALHEEADAIERNGEKRADAIEDGKVPPAPAYSSRARAAPMLHESDTRHESFAACLLS